MAETDVLICLDAISEGYDTDCNSRSLLVKQNCSYSYYHATLLRVDLAVVPLYCRTDQRSWRKFQRHHVTRHEEICVKMAGMASTSC